MGARRTALLLAGGRSVRMGTSKALLPWGSGTMLEAVLEPLREACAKVVVVAHVGQTLPPLPPGVSRVDDPVELDDQGPLVGLLCGLAVLDDDDLVQLAATDKPHLTASAVRWMFERVGEADAAVPVEAEGSTRRHRMHPLSGVLRVGPARAAATSLISAGERALRRVFEALDCNEVRVADLPDPAVLRDYNTPEAYAAGRGDDEP
ncbi:MAG: molybdenum cofactor guanylyltransferase [Nannocystaceae bacterium]|nr:molybdenum cofactor guanylyltransferase [bacterium]